MATPIAPGAAPKDAPIHPKTLHAITPRTGPWWVCLPMGPSQGWGGGSTFGTPWLHYFPNTQDRKYGKWKRRQRDIISPEQGLESGIKSPAPRGSCENTAVTAPGSPPAPLGAQSRGDRPGRPHLGAWHRPRSWGAAWGWGGRSGHGRAARMLGRNESRDYQRGRGIWFLWPRRC